MDMERGKVSCCGGLAERETCLVGTKLANFDLALGQTKHDLLGALQHIPNGEAQDAGMEARGFFRVTKGTAMGQHRQRELSLRTALGQVRLVTADDCWNLLQMDWENHNEGQPGWGRLGGGPGRTFLSCQSTPSL